MMNQPYTNTDSIPWDKILRGIHNQQVLPILGPGLSTIGKNNIPIRKWIAPRLADRLPGDFTNPKNLNQIAGQHLMRGGNRAEIYDEVRLLMDELIEQKNICPSQPLLDLASITDFKLFITSSFDPFLGKALEQQRPGYSVNRNGSAEFHPADPVDIPDSMPSTFLYHILGSYNTYPDFAVWEEDYMEFICGLLEAPKDTRRNLFKALRNQSLLLIGSPFSDWIVRFFLRIAKGERLSSRIHSTQDYIAEELTHMDKPMVFFFDKIIKSPRVLPIPPHEFVAELTARWHKKYSATSANDLLQTLGDDMEHGAVFISYSHDDIDAALSFATGLRSAGIPIWLDKNRLRAGGDWENHLMRAVKSRASLFISLISSATEKAPDRFVHKERKWAGEKHIPGNIFYIPVIIDNTNPPPVSEPPAFSGCHCHKLLEGVITSEFARLIHSYHDQWKQKGEITDV